MRRFKDLLHRKSQPPTHQVAGGSGNAAEHQKTQQMSTSPSSSSSFQSMITRSIAAWDTLHYVGEEEYKVSNFEHLAATLRRFDSINDLFRSTTMFWFFQDRKSFFAQKEFLKWNVSNLDPYVLLPVEQGFVNKRDCFYVSHYWRTREHPDPNGQDFALVRQDMSPLDWQYIWIDWTCLPQSSCSAAEAEYAMRMLRRSIILLRECAFEWRYPAFEPRLWIIVEVAEYMLTSKNVFDPTPDIAPFMDDVKAMQAQGVRQIIRQRGYKCSVNRDYRLLVGWLELLVILTKLVSDIHLRRFVLDLVEPAHISSVDVYDTGISVDKSNGLVSQNGQVFRFVPLYPVGDNMLPKIVADPSILEPPACIHLVAGIINDPELSDAIQQWTRAEKTLGKHHFETVSYARKLAALFSKLGQAIEAQELRRQVLASLQTTLGPNHPHTLDAVAQLAADVESQTESRDLITQQGRNPAKKRHLSKAGANEPPPPPLQVSGTQNAEGQGQCAMCNAPGLGSCFVCRSCRYCSEKCRDQDWPTHRLLCNSFKSFLARPLSQETDIFFKRAVLFPEGSSDLRFVWLKCKREPRGYDSHSASDLLGDDKPMIGTTLVQQIPSRKALDHTIEIIYRDDFGIDDSLHRNQSILTATQGKIAYHWSGNIVAVRRKGLGNNPRHIEDMTMQDFRHAVDFFLTSDGRMNFKVHQRHTYVETGKGSKHRILILGDPASGAATSHVIS